MSQQPGASQLRPQHVINHMLTLASSQQSLLRVRVPTTPTRRPRFGHYRFLPHTVTRPNLPTGHPPISKQNQHRQQQSIEDDLAPCLDGAALYGGTGHADRARALRAELVQLLQVQHEVQGYCSALSSMAGSYNPSATEQTNFDEQLTAIMQRGGR